MHAIEVLSNHPIVLPKGYEPKQWPEITTTKGLTKAIQQLVDASGLADNLTIVLSERRDGNVFAKAVGNAGIDWRLSDRECGKLLPKGEIEAVE